MVLGRTSSHQEELFLNPYFSKRTLKKARSSCVFMFLLLVASLHRPFRTNGKQVDGNSSLRLLFIEPEPRAGDQARTHTLRTHTHSHSLVIINDSMMYRDLMDEQSLLNKRVWLHKTSQPRSETRKKKKC